MSPIMSRRFCRAWAAAVAICAATGIVLTDWTAELLLTAFAIMIPPGFAFLVAAWRTDQLSFRPGSRFEKALIPTVVPALFLSALIMLVGITMNMHPSVTALALTVAMPCILLGAVAWRMRRFKATSGPGDDEPGDD